MKTLSIALPLPSKGSFEVAILSWTSLAPFCGPCRLLKRLRRHCRGTPASIGQSGAGAAHASGPVPLLVACFKDDFGFEFSREFASCLLHGDYWFFCYSKLTSCPDFGQYFNVARKRGFAKACFFAAHILFFTAYVLFFMPVVFVHVFPVSARWRNLMQQGARRESARDPAT